MFDVGCFSFQQFRAVQCREKILLHFRKRPAGDGIPRDQNDFDRLCQFVLMLPETFPQQPPGAIPLDGPADFFARDDAQFRFGPVRQPLPVGDETTEREAPALLPDARELAALLNPRGAAQAQASGVWRPGSGVWGGRGHAKSNRRQAFAAVAAAVGQGGLAALARITVEKSVLAFAADFRRLILAFHKFSWWRAGAVKLRINGAGEVSNETPCVKTGLGVETRH